MKYFNYNPQTDILDSILTAKVPIKLSSSGNCEIDYPLDEIPPKTKLIPYAYHNGIYKMSLSNPEEETLKYRDPDFHTKVSPSYNPILHEMRKLKGQQLKPDKQGYIHLPFSDLYSVHTSGEHESSNPDSIFHPDSPFHNLMEGVNGRDSNEYNAYYRKRKREEQEGSNARVFEELGEPIDQSMGRFHTQIEALKRRGILEDGEYEEPGRIHVFKFKPGGETTQYIHDPSKEGYKELLGKERDELVPIHVDKDKKFRKFLETELSKKSIPYDLRSLFAEEEEPSRAKKKDVEELVRQKLEVIQSKKKLSEHSLLSPFPIRKSKSTPDLLSTIHEYINTTLAGAPQQLNKSHYIFVRKNRNGKILVSFAYEDKHDPSIIRWKPGRNPAFTVSKRRDEFDARFRNWLTDVPGKKITRYQQVLKDLSDKLDETTQELPSIIDKHKEKLNQIIEDIKKTDNEDEKAQLLKTFREHHLEMLEDPIIKKRNLYLSVLLRLTSGIRPGGNQASREAGLNISGLNTLVHGNLDTVYRQIEHSRNLQKGINLSYLGKSGVQYDKTFVGPSSKSMSDSFEAMDKHYIPLYMDFIEQEHNHINRIKDIKRPWEPEKHRYGIPLLPGFNIQKDNEGFKEHMAPILRNVGFSDNEISGMQTYEFRKVLFNIEAHILIRRELPKLLENKLKVGSIPVDKKDLVYKHTIRDILKNVTGLSGNKLTTLKDAYLHMPSLQAVYKDILDKFYDKLDTGRSSIVRERHYDADKDRT